MAARSDSEDDDTFVMIGTPLEPYGEDVPLKKPVTIQDQKVRDEQGRQRFHGAFTGGFSAGYFNTVGTKEGWKPSTFASSRQDRAGKSQQRPEDFMDAEDLGEFGIAPREVKTTGDFKPGMQSLKRPVTDESGVIPGNSALMDLVVPAGISVGVKLLRNLGWKEGQGVGPRVKKKIRKKKQILTHTGQKVYGCSLPSVDQSSSSDEALPENVSFAPKDMSPVNFVPKDNFHGLGYSGITTHTDTMCPTTAGQHRLEHVSSSSRKNVKGIRGQAFGVGALEDDDGDIYSMSNMSEYDTVLGGPDHDNTHGWTAPKHTAGGTRFTDVEPLAEGFKRLSTQLKARKVFPPPSIPRGFKSYHMFSQDDENSVKEAAKIPAKFLMGWKNMDASTRREALGERPEFKSVFDLVNSEAKKKLDEAKSKVEAETCLSGSPVVTSGGCVRSGVSEQQSGSIDSVLPNFEERPRCETSKGTDATQVTETVKSPSYMGSSAYGSFKPFARDPAKQSRYEQYLEYKKQGKQESGTDIWSGQTTEWERDREREEFVRAGQLFRPMSNLMASRFTRAERDDDDITGTQQVQVTELSDQAKAASIKMFGKMTREICEWHPDKVLCKRFNVPNPYPESNIIGLLKIKRDKYSVFNFLSLPGESTEQVQKKVEKPPDTEPVKKAPKQRGKPLAILASVDLSVPTPLPCRQSDTGIEGIDPVAAGSQEPAEKPERPPLDLFKAIFDDSDEESKPSSDEDDTKSEHEHELGNTPPNQDIKSTALGVFDRFMVPIQPAIVSHSSRDTKTATVPAPHPAIVSHSPRHSELPETSEHFDDLHQRLRGDSPAVTNDPTLDDDDMYGPVLPPALQTTVVEDSCGSNSHTRPKKKKHKEKEKYKHKKKKTKHKKHKNKEKKKTATVRISSSEKSDSDGSDTAAPSDILLLAKLRAVNR